MPHSEKPAKRIQTHTHTNITHTCMHAYIHAYTHAHTYTYRHAHTHTHIHAYTYIHPYMHRSYVSVVWCVSSRLFYLLSRRGTNSKEQQLVLSAVLIPCSHLPASTRIFAAGAWCEPSSQSMGRGRWTAHSKPTKIPRSSVVCSRVLL